MGDSDAARSSMEPSGNAVGTYSRPMPPEAVGVQPASREGPNAAAPPTRPPTRRNSRRSIRFPHTPEPDRQARPGHRLWPICHSVAITDRLPSADIRMNCPHLEVAVYRNIVCGVSRAGTGLEAAARAAEVSRLTGATLHVVHAFSGSPVPGEHAGPGQPLGRHEAEQFLESQWGRVDGVRTHAMPGDPAAAVLQVAAECDADLVVVGNLGIERRFLSSVPSTIVRDAPCDVLVVATT